MTSTTCWSSCARSQKTEPSRCLRERNCGRTQHLQQVQTSICTLQSINDREFIRHNPRCHQDLQGGTAWLSPFTRTWNPDLSQRKLDGPGLSCPRLSGRGDGLHGEMARAHISAVSFHNAQGTLDPDSIYKPQTPPAKYCKLQVPCGHQERNTP